MSIIPEKDAQYKLIQILQQYKKSPRELRHSIKGYTKHVRDRAEAFSSQCDRIIALGDHGQAEPVRGGQDYIPDDFPAHVNGALPEALQLLSACISDAHILVTDTLRPWHHTRLHLSHALQIQENRAMFDIVVASLKMTFWQEYQLEIPMYLTSQLLRSAAFKPVD